MGYNKELSEQLNKLRNSATVIIGIGNTLKGDDGAGPLVCEQLSGKVCAELIDAGTVPENYIQTIIKKLRRICLLLMLSTLEPRLEQSTYSNLSS